jgi:hypothetical protein
MFGQTSSWTDAERKGKEKISPATYAESAVSGYLGLSLITGKGRQNFLCSNFSFATGE